MAHQQYLMKKSRNKIKPSTLQVGDIVLFYNSRYVHFLGKLHTCWLGPCMVHAVFQNSSIQVGTLEGEIFPVRVHFNQLKKYYMEV